MQLLSLPVLAKRGARDVCLGVVDLLAVSMD